MPIPTQPAYPVKSRKNKNFLAIYFPIYKLGGELKLGNFIAALYICWHPPQIIHHATHTLHFCQSKCKNPKSSSNWFDYIMLSNISFKKTACSKVVVSKLIKLVNMHACTNGGVFFDKELDGLDPYLVLGLRERRI